MKLLLTILLLVVGVYGRSQSPERKPLQRQPLERKSPEQRLVGTWRRYGNHRLLEVFVMRPDHSWASDLYDAQGNPAGKEKGKWKLQDNYLTFDFTLPVQSPATAPFTFKSDRKLVIGKNVYYRR